MATAKFTENPLTSDSTNKHTGAVGEDMAVSLLEATGYKIIERNYRCLFGEIDIIARDGSVIVFVEVKSRRSKLFGEPELSVDLNKQKKLSKVALHYLGEQNLHNTNARFDVVAILLIPGRDEVRHIENAFDLAY